MAHGLIVDGFGAEASSLLQRIMETFDSKTRSVAGLALVSSYHQEMRLQLKGLLDTGIQEAFAAIVENLQVLALKRLQTAMLRTVNDSAESIVESNAAALRKESFTVETLLEDMEVLTMLGLTKENAARDISNELRDAVMSFPDSHAAQLKRTKQVNTVVNNERKPSQRSVDLGLDLVAVLRPDGFGSLQGYAGYQLGIMVDCVRTLRSGNIITCWRPQRCGGPTNHCTVWCCSTSASSGAAQVASGCGVVTVDETENNLVATLY